MHVVAMLIAALGAAFLSVGTQLQSSGARLTASGVDAEGRGGFSFRQIFALLRRKRWVFGTLMLGVAVVFQLTALTMAPLIVVQPVGALALVFTTVLNTRVAHVRLNPRALVGVVLCTAGTGVFVTVAALVAVDNEVTDGKLLEVISVLGAVLIVLGGAFWVLHSRLRAFAFVVGAGVLYGFVATLAKVVISRIMQGQFEWLTLACVAGLLAASLLGGWFVQDAHASGPPDLVIAGLTVIDPLVAVTIGIVLLGEARQASPLVAAVFIVSGILAVLGVALIARFHPQSGVAGVTAEMEILREKIPGARGGRSARRGDAGKLDSRSLPPGGAGR